MDNDVSINGSRLINVADQRLEPLSKLVLNHQNCQPEIWRFYNVLALPGKTGLYDHAGFRIDESSWSFVTNQSLLSASRRAKIGRELEKGHPAKIDIALALERYGDFRQIEEPTLFLGGMNQHYGHWLIDFTSRLWAANLPQLPKSRFMLPAPWAFLEDKPYDVSYMSPFFKWANLQNSDVCGLDRPTIFHEVVIPEPSLQLLHVIFSAADTSHLGVANDMPLDEIAHCGKRVYLSRRRLNSSIKTVQDESIIEDYFLKLGFFIAYPEEMPFVNQVILFNNAEIIAGFAGSAFHTGMLSLPSFKGVLLIICGDEMINTRFVLQGAIKSYSTVFVRGYDCINGDTFGNLPIHRANIELLKSGLRIFGL